MSDAFLYLLLGPAHSGRRKILTDLIATGLTPGDRPVVLLPAAAGAQADNAALAKAHPNLIAGDWRWTDGRFVADVPPGATHYFVVADGRSDPVDQIEALPAFLAEIGAELGRILTVVDCALAHREPKLKAWFDACIHFSDVVLLNHREGVPNKWISDFLARLKHESLPCLTEMVKRGQVRNPPLILNPEPRRISLFFDPLEDVLDDEDETDDDDVSAEPPVDKYLERLNSGRRAKEIPDIAAFLDRAAEDK